MKLEHFSYIQVIHETGSFNQAATHLFLSQPYLSAVIKDLEQELGYPLFTRSNRGVTLTQRGEVFLQHAKEILSHVEAIKAINKVQPGKAVVIRVIGFTSYLFLDLYHDYTQLKTSSECTFLYEEIQNPMVFEQMLVGNCDLGFIYLETSQLDKYHKVFSNAKVKFTPIYTGPVCAIVSKNHPLADSTVLTKEMLCSYPILIESFKMASMPLHSISSTLIEEFKSFTFEPNRFENNKSLLYYLTKSDKAFSLGQSIFNNTNPMVQNGELVYIPILGLSSDLTTGYLVREDEKQIKEISGYIEYLIQRLNEIVNLL